MQLWQEFETFNGASNHKKNEIQVEIDAIDFIDYVIQKVYGVVIELMISDSLEVLEDYES